jgi:hypothetical protein
MLKDGKVLGFSFFFLQEKSCKMFFRKHTKETSYALGHTHALPFFRRQRGGGGRYDKICLRKRAGRNLLYGPSGL